MTLDKHKIDGVPQITVRVLPTEEFDALLAMPVLLVCYGRKPRSGRTRRELS